MSTTVRTSAEASQHHHNDKIEQHAQHHEGHANIPLTTHDDSLIQHGFAHNTDSLPPGYFRSTYFIGTFLAIGMNLACSTGGFALIAPVLGSIDVDIGPGPIIWVALVYTLGLAIGLTLVGRLTDLFGRRWFFISGVCLGIVGAIVAGTAHTIPVLIGGETLLGLSASTGYSYAFVSGELVPVKYRFWMNAGIFLFSMPTAGFGAAISTAFILHTEAGWRWSYYLLIILHCIAAVLYFCFYFPPNFEIKHRAHGESRWDIVKNYDFIGTLLYLAGLLL